MGDISKSFNRSEFACKCGCGQDTIDAKLVEVLQNVRDYFDKPVTITSGNRCKTYNTSIGGAKSSQHVLSRAADIVVKGVNPIDVQYFLLSEYPDSLGIGSYPDFTHIDSRNQCARW